MKFVVSVSYMDDGRDKRSFVAEYDASRYVERMLEGVKDGNLPMLKRITITFKEEEVNS